MKTKLFAFLALGFFSTLTSHLSTALAQGTAFTYTGRLNDGGSPANGSYDLTFALFANSSGEPQVGGTLTNAALGVADGLFTVTLDFGGNFPGADRFLEIGARTNGSGAFTTLIPRQKIIATPYAITAGEVTSANIARLNVSNTAQQATGVPVLSSGFITAANLTFRGSGYTTPPTVTVNDATGSGAVITATVSDGISNRTVPAGQVVALTVNDAGSGYSPGATLTIGAPPSNAFQTFPGTNLFTNPGNTFAGKGAGLTGVNAATLGGLAVSNLWKLGGNTGANPTNGAFLGTTDNLPLEIKVNGQRALRIEPATNANLGYSPNVLSGFSGNIISNGFVGAVIGGGGSSSFPNRVGGHFATVVGGSGNTASGSRSTAMGFETTANDNNSTAMGFRTTASGFASTAMGSASTASGNDSTAMGYRAKANHAGAFVWADTRDADFASTANDQFSVRAGGGALFAANVQIGTGNGDYRQLRLGGGNSAGFLYGSYPALNDGIHLSYNHYYDQVGDSQLITPGGASSRVTVGYGFVRLAVGNVNGAPTTQRLLANSSGVTVNGTFNNQSDRNAKQDFAPVSPSEILEKVAHLPLSEWSYKEDPATRHIGPVAQDFHSAFNIGTDDKHIAPMDEGGVALAAIQGLNQKVEEQGDELKQKQTEITELKARLEKLERLMNEKNGGAR